MSNGFDGADYSNTNNNDKLNEEIYNSQNNNGFNGVNDEQNNQKINVKPVNVIPVVNPEPVNVIPVVNPEPVNVIPVVNPEPVNVIPVVNPEPVNVIPVVNPEPIHVEPQVVIHQRKKQIKKKEYLGGENINEVYLSVNFNEMIQNFDKIEIKVLTKDQGWASVDDSSSWFDLRITNPNGEVLAKKDRIIENFKVENYEKKKFKVKRNDKNLGEFMKDGNRLELVARSQYQGWEIHVEKATIHFDD
jgi:hypothetical protein